MTQGYEDNVDVDTDEPFVAPEADVDAPDDDPTRPAPQRKRPPVH